MIIADLQPILQFFAQPISEAWTGTPGWLKFMILAHAVNTCPTPESKWLQWVLGTIKFGVGQRNSGMNAINGLQTEVTAVTTAQKAALANGSTMEVIKTAEGVLKPIDPDRQSH